jgi:GNAT superfamily N-acetyltransferase
MLHPPRRRRRRDRGGRGGRFQDHRRSPRTLAVVQVTVVPATDLARPLALLEESLRDGEPLPQAFLGQLREAVEAENLEVLAARMERRVVGVVVLAFRLNVAAAGLFASIEDLYVRTESRRRGVGRALLEAVAERCGTRGVSYVEALVEDEVAAAFYSALGYEPEAGVRVFSRSYLL